MRVWKSTTYNQKKNAMEMTSRNQPETTNSCNPHPLRSDLLTISTIHHLRKNCKNSQTRLPHRICKQDQAWTNIQQHSKLQTQKKKTPWKQDSITPTEKTCIPTTDIWTKWPQPPQGVTKGKKKGRGRPHSCSLATKTERLSSTYTHVEMIDSFHQSKLLLVPTNRKVWLKQPKG